MRANLACFAFACGSAVDVRASLPTRQTRQTSMSTARGSTEGSEPRTRGRTRPRLLVGEKESSRCGNRSATYSSSSSCLSPQSGGGCLAMCRAPYMDVQTVKTNLTADQAAMLEGQSHCLLLVEPVLLPHLGHTGVGKEPSRTDRRLFYPNGHKNSSLGATVRDTLYESGSAPSRRAVGRQQRQQNPPSDWAGSSAYFSLSDSSSSQHHRVSAAVPAGQGGRFPTDVWGTPPPTGSRRSGPTSRSALDTQEVRYGEAGGSEEGGGSVVLRRKADGARARQQRQQQNEQHRGLGGSSSASNPSQSGGKTSTSNTASSRITLASGLAGPTGIEGGGRDSEWQAERRAADREAKEVLGALKRTSTRLWFLVGGSV